ncbi:putative membrane protein [Chromobacterium alkanivorans]|uniref:hypothetical protein n=1 Tax=Chromobacterium alkanivorans TaxID=1071719 RepID=UPI0021677531|nr:hypothetical protein [Chromobacterium alkanivorans]MCS3802603.1 putative membrane protein [Chromobacterium alkanivorans]MCS3816929.1 putative membrane protein [Chromobacterium alkanivorans]MCS3871969.1 putative membrane protein [Chromobacterium alkanivorans]
MKHDACIQQLQLTMERLPEAELRKILSDYREYIRDAVADQRNESRLIAALADSRRRTVSAFAHQGSLSAQWARLTRHALGGMAAACGVVAMYWLFMQ